MRLSKLGVASTLSLFLATSIALTGCMDSNELTNFGNEAEVRLPIENQGQFSFESIVLQGISNFQTLKGPTVDFVLYPKSKGTSITGVPGHFKFSKSASGGLIAKDSLSLQAALLIYHFQEFRKLDSSLGLDGLLNYPRQVGLAIDEKISTSNNAYYDGKTDSFIFVPFKKDTLPLISNSGVLAHEHFHSIFAKLVGNDVREKMLGATELSIQEGVFVADPKQEKPTELDSIELNEDDRKVYHTLVLRGINEGLADVWAWVYTGNPDFLALSLPAEKNERSLEKPQNLDITPESVESLKWRVLDTQNDSPEARLKYLNFVAYKYGTQLSRSLKLMSHQFASKKNLSDKEARNMIAKAIVASLPLLQQECFKVSIKGYLSTTVILDLIKGKLEQ